MPGKPHIILVIPRGEAVRNFLYSDTLKILGSLAKVTVLSVVDTEELRSLVAPYVDDFIPLREYPVHWLPAYLRSLVENAHERWLWSKVAQNNWELRDRRAREQGKTAQRWAVKTCARILANPACLHLLSRAERFLQWKLRTTQEFDSLFKRLKPDLVFNGSHIHGPAGELPLRIAKGLGIKTAGFVFSWDNLTSRSRIMVPYDYWFVWHEPMKQQLLQIYPRIPAENIFVTGTPQLDFHLRPEYIEGREQLCRRIGIDPGRPFILYTTGLLKHFPEEFRHVDWVIHLVQTSKLNPKPQLVVRNYIKHISPELMTRSKQALEDVVFPPMLWDPEWATPLPEDLTLYCSLVHHAALSINAASTVTLEFYLKDKPVINLDYDPPGSNLAPCDGFKRHIRFDHFWPVAQSGGSMLAQSTEDMARMISQAISDPSVGSKGRHQYMKTVFGGTADGNSGRRVAEALLYLAEPLTGLARNSPVPLAGAAVRPSHQDIVAAHN
jgi:hypothetical protein